MKKIKWPYYVAMLTAVVVLISATKKTAQPKAAPTKKIQVAVLLDVSGSMSGLIEQTKTQLWTMVNTLGAANADGKVPQLEIALYEYGRTGNEATKGFVKQINSFISDLDSLSENLFKLTTNGGEEYCGEVIYASIDELPWSAENTDYKVVFIAGNEDFLQGKRHFNEGCKKATEKNIIVNTIYCGPKEEGIRLHWNLMGECGNGAYRNINSNVQDEYIPAPQDSMIYVLNTKMNGTYLNYGYYGAAKIAKQVTQDDLNDKKSKKAGIERTLAKAKASSYDNSSWDLVDASKNGGKQFDFVDLDRSTLPDTLRNKTTEELKLIIENKSKEREVIRENIQALNKERLVYLDNYRKTRAASSEVPTLESEMTAVLREQAKRFNIIIQ